TARGDRQEDIYLNDEDRCDFLEVLSGVQQRFNWLIHAYCLMDNHYHLLVETPDGNLSQGMRQLNGVYTQNSNRRHQRVGHVFQGRYKAILVQKESYLLELARYIVLNPVRARMVRKAESWPWSSYRDTAGLRQAPDWLTTEWVLSAFAKQKARAIKKYCEFIKAGKHQPSPWDELHNQVFLGDEQYVKRIRQKIDADKDLSEIPKSQRRPKPKAIAEYAKESTSRNAGIMAAYASGGYSLKEIGEYYSLHYSQVSRIVKSEEHAKCKT
ncbi:MAG TPA: addiction module toxin RelE, partial [Gammaproteobacteria bacterium]|nr:addiction module toxin RelE [Gammaproteobacteria bacterium]